MRVAINLVKMGEADAVVSAGNTGALMATARYVLKTFPGIDRPAADGDRPRKHDRRRFERPPGLRRPDRHPRALTDRFEGNSAAPWKIDDAPADYIDGLCRAIIGIEIRLTRIEGKWKMSQNKAPHDRLGAIAGLRAQGGETSLKLAELVEAASGDDK